MPCLVRLCLWSVTLCVMHFGSSNFGVCGTSYCSRMLLALMWQQLQQPIDALEDVGTKETGTR